MGRDKGLWGNKERVVANFFVITQWDTVPGNLTTSDGEAETEALGESIPEMGKSICGELLV